MTTTQKIKKFRLKNGFTQQDMSIHLGICDTTYRKIESGETSPSVDMLRKIAKLFNKRIVDFLEDDDSYKTYIRELEDKIKEYEKENKDLLKVVLDYQARF